MKMSENDRKESERKRKHRVKELQIRMSRRVMRTVRYPLIKPIIYNEEVPFQRTCQLLKVALLPCMSFFFFGRPLGASRLFA